MNKNYEHLYTDCNEILGSAVFVKVAGEDGTTFDLVSRKNLLGHMLRERLELYRVSIARKTEVPNCEFRDFTSSQHGKNAYLGSRDAKRIFPELGVYNLFQEGSAEIIYKYMDILEHGKLSLDFVVNNCKRRMWDYRNWKASKPSLRVMVCGHELCDRQLHVMKTKGLKAVVSRKKEEKA